jgi:ER degradation enhancer, mannosidase alpha-like 2
VRLLRVLLFLLLGAALASVGCATPHRSTAAGTERRPVPVDDAADRAAEVRREMQHAWNGYRRYAWGHDELQPLSRSPRDWYAETLLMTPVDALDTLHLMHLDAEANQARALIDERLSFDRDIFVKTFEITIRELGGLLSAYQLTHDPRLLELARDLGRRLAPAFASPTGMPYVYVNLRTGAVRDAKSNPAEIGTLILEFGTLARLTGQPRYYDLAKRALVALWQRRSPLGLVGSEIDVETGRWLDTTAHVSGGIDSYYEYLVKGARLFGDDDLSRMARDMLAAVNRHLADETPTGLWYGSADMMSGRRTATTFGALDAFLPAVLVLADDLDRARRLQDSAYRMWRVAGLEPEIYDYRAGRITSPAYHLRPEIIESAYYLHRRTRDPRYRDMGRTFLHDLEASCRTDVGYAAVSDVRTKAKTDRMESYFLAETLKYLYLLFAPDDALPLDEIVLNTEAHPLRRTW